MLGTIPTSVALDVEEEGMRTVGLSHSTPALPVCTPLVGRHPRARTPPQAAPQIGLWKRFSVVESVGGVVHSGTPGDIRIELKNFTGRGES